MFVDFGHRWSFEFSSSPKNFIFKSNFFLNLIRMYFQRIAAALTFLALASANLHDRAYYEEKFFEWLQDHKVLAQSGVHFVKMLQNFANNHDLIETHNSGNHSYTLGCFYRASYLIRLILLH